MPESMQLYIADPQLEDHARQLADRWGFVVSAQPPAEFGLLLDEQGLSLKDFSEPKLHPVRVDFLSGSSIYRKQHGGGKGEPIVKAIGLKGHTDYHVVDATPGLGRDAFVLASVGCRVTLIERSAVVAALLEDGIRRLASADSELAGRFSLHHGNSAQVMQYWDAERVDAVFLDPMFPHKKKSALVKKEMRIFQQLVGPDDDAGDLLSPACALAHYRVAVKRPNHAGALNDTPPTMAISGKKHRFDVYITKTA
ncbi:class I SAM-dependent methyltransferase [Alteromonas sp. ASW11-19]|uniref:Ribosomal RNA small subunit methyltransferase J n=1 Tax=Alteromonas salexigens TaxID=2982530 RepID=A0ABT2VQP1_9ALTE|nr:class I SAM-dependent methyltransferase [Alteromonas salexigens]MCU7554758.1 class I SAM-dependent methyltransferase [Alteromonas salexigens]